MRNPLSMTTSNLIRFGLTILVIMSCLGTSGCTPEELFNAAATSTGTVTGTVSDIDGRPVSSALVSAKGTSWASLTTGDGMYVMTLPVGLQELTVSRDGFESLTLPVEVTPGVSGEAARRDFSLAPLPIVDPVGVRLHLTSKQIDHDEDDPVTLALTVTNEGSRPVKIPTASFVAVDERGAIVWQVREATPDLLLSPGETTTFSRRWVWSAETPPPSGVITCYGTVRLATEEGIVERLSTAHRVRLFPATGSGNSIPFRTIAQGVQSNILERRGFVIATPEEFKRFWFAHHGDSEPLPEIDFRTMRVVAAMGGRHKGMARVEITGIEGPLTTSRTDTIGSGRVQVKLTVPPPSILPVEPVEDYTRRITSPYHIVIVPPGTNHFEFLWSVSHDPTRVD